MVKETVFQKLAKVQQILRKYCEITDKEFPKIIRKLGNCHYKKNSNLTDKELRVLEMLLARKYNPYTVYRWFLLTNCSDEVKQKLMRGMIGQKRASKKKQVYKKMYSVEEKDLHVAVMDCFERYLVR